VGATVEVATTSASTLNFEGLGQDRPQRPTGKHLLRLIFSTGQEIVPQPYTGSGFFRSPYGPARSRKLHSRAQVEAGEGGGAGARREGRPGWQRCTVCGKLLVVICCGTTVADPDGKDGDGRAQQALRHTAHHQSCARLYPSLPKPSLPTTEWCGVLGRRSASSATAAGTATPSRGLPPSPPATTAPSRRRYTASSGLSPPPSTSHGPTPPSRASAPSASPTTLASIVPLLLS
jgi:hypothetical protein